jgi:FixJ family two-component response regulator
MQAVYPNQASVLILDDDAALRSAYVRILGDAGYYCKEFESLPKFIEAIEKSSLELNHACCLLDMKMSAGSGLEAQAWLAEYKLQLPIVFVSGQSDIAEAITAMRNGAVDFLLKPVSEDRLVAAIDSALNSQANHSEQLPKGFEVLTPRESQILRLVVSGLRSQQIADQLGITLRTVKMHRGNIMSKMRVENVAQLLALYHQRRQHHA